MLLAGMLGHSVRVREAIDLLEEQREVLADRPELLTKVEVAMANLTQFDEEGRDRTTEIRAEFRRRTEDGSENDPGVLTTVATDLLFAGRERERCIALASKALESREWETTYTALGWSRLLAMRVLSMADEFAVARRATEKGVEEAFATGASLDYGGCLSFRAQVAMRVGDISSAEVDLRTALDLARRAGWVGASGLVLSYLGEVLVDKGAFDEAEELLGVPEGSQDPARGYSAVNVWFARGRLRLAQGASTRRRTTCVRQGRGLARLEAARVRSEGDMPRPRHPGAERRPAVEDAGEVRQVARPVARRVGVGDVLGDHLLPGAGVRGKRAGEVEDAQVHRDRRSGVNAGLTLDG